MPKKKRLPPASKQVVVSREQQPTSDSTVPAMGGGVTAPREAAWPAPIRTR